MVDKSTPIELFNEDCMTDKVTISSTGRASPPTLSPAFPPDFEERLSRIESMLGIKRQEVPLDFEHAVIQLLQGNRKPFEDYCQMRKESNQKEVV